MAIHSSIEKKNEEMGQNKINKEVEISMRLRQGVGQTTAHRPNLVHSLFFILEHSLACWLIYIDETQAA